MTYRDRFEAMVRNLERNPRVKVRKAKFRAPATESLIAWAKTRAGGALPEGMEAFYRSMNGFELSWEPSKPGAGAGGAIDILPLHRVLGDWEGSIWFRDADGGEAFRSVRPLDFFVEEACAALILPEGGQLADEVVYHALGEEVQHTGHSFEAWIDKLLAARGYFYWIRTLCPSSQPSPEAAGFRTIMPTLFDDYDDHLFQPKAI